MKKEFLKSVAAALVVADVDSPAKVQGLSFESAGNDGEAPHKSLVADIADNLGLDDKEKMSFEADNTMIAKAAIMSAAPQSFFQEPVSSKGLVVGATEFGLEEDVEAVSLEAFSGDNPSLIQSATFQYNLQASKQDDVWEALYPTIYGDPAKAGMQIIIDVPYTHEEFLRTSAGRSADKANRRTIIESMNDENGIFGKNKLVMIPVYSAVTDKYLVSDFQQSGVTYDAIGETVTTAPYKSGTVVNTLDACQSDAMLAKGIMTEQDGLSRRISVKSLAFTIGADKILIDTPFAPYWGYTLDGSSRDVQTTSTNMFDIDLSTLTQFDGSPTTEFGSAPAGYSARFELRVSGHGNLVDSDLVVDVNEFRFVGAVDANGTLLTSGTAYDALYDICVDDSSGTPVSKWTNVGYYLNIAIHNKNLRNAGILITSDPKGKYIPFEAFTPVSTAAPVAGQDIGETDASFINKLTMYPRLFASMNAAITTMDFVNYMDSLPSGSKASVNAAGEVVITPTMTGGLLDLNVELDSLRSGERAMDIKALFETKLSLAITEALAQSRYFTFNEVHAGGGTIDIAVVTDLETASVLGKTMDFGGSFNVKVFGTANSKFSGKIIAVPTRFNISDRTKPEVRAFGNYFYAPTPVTEVVKTVSNSTHRLFEVNPIGTHEIIMPVMAKFDVSGLSAALGKVKQHILTASL